MGPKCYFGGRNWFIFQCLNFMEVAFNCSTSKNFHVLSLEWSGFLLLHSRRPEHNAGCANAFIADRRNLTLNFSPAPMCLLLCWYLVSYPCWFNRKRFEGKFNWQNVPKKFAFVVFAAKSFCEKLENFYNFFGNLASLLPQNSASEPCRLHLHGKYLEQSCCFWAINVSCERSFGRQDLGKKEGLSWILLYVRLNRYI